jgi:glycosyltransferase involved in cell wall biosynthesis
VSDAELVELYRAAVCLVFCSRGEGFGFPVVEAMSCGTPVVATGRGSVPEIVLNGDTGIVLEPDAGIEEIAEALHAAVDIDPRRCRVSVAERFTPAHLADGYEEVYRSVLAANRGRSAR